MRDGGRQHQCTVHPPLLVLNPILRKADIGEYFVGDINPNFRAYRRSLIGKKAPSLRNVSILRRTARSKLFVKLVAAESTSYFAGQWTTTALTVGRWTWSSLRRRIAERLKGSGAGGPRPARYACSLPRSTPFLLQTECQFYNSLFQIGARILPLMQGREMEECGEGLRPSQLVPPTKQTMAFSQLNYFVCDLVLSRTRARTLKHTLVMGTPPGIGKTTQKRGLLTQHSYPSIASTSENLFHLPAPPSYFLLGQSKKFSCWKWFRFPPLLGSEPFEQGGTNRLQPCRMGGCWKKGNKQTSPLLALPRVIGSTARGPRRRLDDRRCDEHGRDLGRLVSAAEPFLTRRTRPFSHAFALTYP